MKPRTKLEKEVVRLSHNLCPRKRELKRAVKNLQNETPNTYYHVIAEVKGGYQVFRFFRIRIYKRKPTDIWETQQIWYAQGRELVVARQRTMGIYYDCYIKNSDLELRHNYRNFAYNTANMIPISTTDCVSLLPIFSKEEIDKIGSLSAISDRYLLMTSSPYMETLYKQHRDVFMAFLDKVPVKDILSNQNEIKVALRHHYEFEDVVMWNDAMKLAKHFGIETRNPYYCAPKNIEVLHNSLIRRKAKEEAEKEKETLMKYEAAYYNHIEPFLEMVLKGTNVVIVPLKSVMEVYMEGRMMHHCVYACKYWKKDDVLLLSAQVNGAHVETIEFNLKSLKVSQSRGLQNKQTEYHEEILALMKANAKNIKKLTRRKAA